MTRELLSGNEAIAQGAWQAGVALGTGYPGTPSTEVLESLSQMRAARAEWAPNEKVALEVAVGASLGGVRALATMKHVGLNVAADPLFTCAYTGVGAGLVVLVADDPGMHSSQNEQDSRNYAPFARVPMLEPSDSAEALEMTSAAFDLSEETDLPVMVRSTTRLSHAKGLVERGARTERDVKPYSSAWTKWVMLPANARERRVDLDRRLSLALDASEKSPFNRIEIRDPSLGIVTSGIPYQFVREALPEASTLKLGMSFPLPEKRVREFAAAVERLVVIEELDPFLTRAIRSLGIEISEVDLPRMGELTPGAVTVAMGGESAVTRDAFAGLPGRPPMLCPGCPHRGVFHALRSMDAIVMGDIGCYTLAALPPLSRMDSCLCMGAGIGMAHGLTRAGSAGDRPVVAVIGDSTFAHSGLTALMNMAYNNGAAAVVVLDNRVTAMTGHQDNPFTGRTLMGEPAPEIDVAEVCRALGVADVKTVDPNLLKPTEKALRAAVGTTSPAVVVAKAPCALLIREERDPYAIDEEKCTACGECVSLGCPAIAKVADGKAVIDIALCVGCRQCVQVCAYGAISRTGPACDAGSG